MKQFLSILIVLCIICYKADAQLIFSGSKWTIGSMQVSDCSYNLIGLPPPTFLDDVYNDVALTPDGRILVVNAVSQPGEGIKETNLIVINPDNVLESDTILVIDNVLVFGLTCTSDYMIYLAGKELHTYNLLTEELTFLGSNPAGRPAGDLIWYQNELYGSLAWINLNDEDHPPQFIRYGGLEDGTVSSNSTIVTENLPLFLGLATVYDYENERMRLIGSYGERTSNASQRDTSTMYEIFLEDTTYTTLCKVVLQPYNRFIDGLASADQFRTNFQLQLDLDADDSSGRFIDHHQADGLCVRTFPLADEDARIHAPQAGVDSLVVELATGVHPAGEETIAAIALPGFQLLGNNTPRLLVIPDDVGNIAGLEALVAQMQLDIAGDDLQTGERRVDFRLYSDGQVSDAAMAFVYPQPDVVPYPGESYTVGSCPIDIINLFTGLGENVYDDGHWSPELRDGGDYYQTGFTDPGVYHYIVQEGSCGPDTASVTVSEFPQLVTNYGGETNDVQVIYFCPGDTVNWLADTSAILSWEWNVAPYSSTEITITEPGTYSLIAIDTNGCDYYMRTFFREPDWEEMGPGLLVDTVSRCEGQTFDFFGTTITKDTTICGVYPSTSDCDYTHCRTFQFTPDVETMDTDTICEGETYHWRGQLYTEEGLYEQLIENAASSCDTIARLELIVHPVYERNLIVNLIPGGSFTVGDSVLTQAGLYSILLQSSQGCDSLVNVQVESPNSIVDPLAENCKLPTLLYKGQSDWGPVCQATIQFKEWALYDAQGRRLKQAQLAAENRVLLPSNEQIAMSAGIYFYRLEYEWNGERKQTSGKLVLVE